jgi:hypothetical protein
MHSEIFKVLKYNLWDVRLLRRSFAQGKRQDNPQPFGAQRGREHCRRIIGLLEGGCPDGALAQWGSLHEIAVTALFLQKNKQEIAHR